MIRARTRLETAAVNVTTATIAAAHLTADGAARLAATATTGTTEKMTVVRTTTSDVTTTVATATSDVAMTGVKTVVSMIAVATTAKVLAPQKTAEEARSTMIVVDQTLVTPVSHPKGRKEHPNMALNI